MLQSEQHRALQRLYTRFKVRPGGASGLVRISSIIQPITDLDELLRDYGVHSGSLTAAIAASTWQTVYTVPANRRAWISCIAIERISGDNTWDRIRAVDANIGTSYGLQLFTTAAGQTEVFHYLGHALVLEQLDYLQVRCEGAGAGATVIRTVVWGGFEDAY